MSSPGQYIHSLIKEGKQKQSDIARAIGVQRQLISYAIAGKRELSISLALKLESYFNLSDENFDQLQPKYNISKDTGKIYSY